jgi:hypothetical protein
LTQEKVQVMDWEGQPDKPDFFFKINSQRNLIYFDEFSFSKKLMGF